MSPLPPLRALQVFDAVGHSRNLADAARRLNVTPGAITQQLRILEESVGVRLTFKDGKQVRLTPAGRRFHEACSAGFEALREAAAALERSGSQAHLSVSALPSLLKTWLAPLVFDWQEAEYPSLSIEFKGSHAEPAEDQDDVDFRITYGNESPPGWASVELYTDSVVPVCSPSLLAGRAPLVDPSELLDYPLLATDWRPRFTSPPSWREWFAAAGVDLAPQPNIRSPRIFSLSHMAIDSAAAGHGIALAQCSMIMQDIAAGRLAILFTASLPLPWPYVLTWKPSVFDRPHCRSFHRWLVARGKLQAELNRTMLEEAGSGEHAAHSPNSSAVASARP